MNSLLLTMVLIFYLQGDNVREREYNLDDDGVAIQGYDPVSYFNSKEPREGKKGISYSYRGVTYYFYTEENRQNFKLDPSKYEPAYGGWCAYAMGNSGEKVKIDPETFKIVDGRLYLFYNFFFNNTLKTWNEDEMALRKKADSNWQQIIKGNQ